MQWRSREETVDSVRFRKESKDDNASTASAAVVTVPSTVTPLTSGEGNATTEAATWTKVEKRKKKKVAKEEAKNDVCVYLSPSFLSLATILSYSSEGLSSSFRSFPFLYPWRCWHYRAASQDAKFQFYTFHRILMLTSLSSLDLCTRIMKLRSGIMLLA